MAMLMYLKDNKHKLSENNYFIIRVNRNIYLIVIEFFCREHL